MIKQHSAGIILYTIHENKILYLLLHYLSGHWDFPKGKLEAGETLTQAALRELLEETALTAQIIPGFQESLVYIFKERGKLIEKTVVFFVGVGNYNQPITLSREHQGYTWLSFEDAYQQLTYKNAQEILEKANRFTKETLKER